MTVFVFSGGGSNGAAQVGMLEELYARGITPDAVVGVSAGALNAVGLATDPVEWYARVHQAWHAAAHNGIFRQSPSRAVWAILRHRVSIDSGALLHNILTDHLTVTRLEDCVLPIRIGTVVLATGEMRWHSSGSAYDILKASCAIPGILPPVLIDGELHVDGGVCSPVPVAAAIEFAPTRLVVLDVSRTAEDHAETMVDPTALTVLLRSFEAARRRVAAAELAALTPDLELIYIRTGADNAFGETTLAKMNALIDDGRRAAREVLDALAPIPNSAMSLSASGPRPAPRVPRVTKRDLVTTRTRASRRRS